MLPFYVCVPWHVARGTRTAFITHPSNKLWTCDAKARQEGRESPASWIIHTMPG